MQSLSVYARLFARAISGTEAENILFNGLIRLSSSSSSSPAAVHVTQPSHRLAITCPTSAIRRAVHLVTASSGYSNHDGDEHERLARARHAHVASDEQRSNVYGDDAFFVTKHRLGDFLGVADGVGGWREHGIDPSLFSSSLMEACKSLIDNKLLDLNPLTLKELLSKGYKQLLEDKQCIIGSSTACIVALHNEKRILHTANLGDSGFVVIRKNTIVHRSQEQQHYFNSPFQLAIHPTVKDPRLIADSPDLASVTSFHVEENDYIVIATDGLWDNLPDVTIVDEVKKITEPTLDNLQRIAQRLAQRALQNGNDPNYYSPFARSAKRSLGINICDPRMATITPQTIRRCSLTLGRFDSQIVDFLVTMFHKQGACTPLASSPNHLQGKFENLLTTKTDANEAHNDTPLTRIELAVLVQFKRKYLEGVLNVSLEQYAPKATVPLAIDNELNQAYAFLFAYVDDRLSANEHLPALKFLSRVQEPVTSLFDIYERSSQSFADFFVTLLSYGYLAKELVAVDTNIRNFQLFIRRYEHFLLAFNESCQSLTHTDSKRAELDPITSENYNYDICSYVMQLLPPRQPSSVPSVAQPVTPSVPTPEPISTVRQKGLCVIINIQMFTSSAAEKRAGSDKDVDVVQAVFSKLGFTVLECKFDFKKNDLDRALDYIDNKAKFGNFESLVVFIMSHGYLHTFCTADAHNVVIRDLVIRYSDASTNTIWARKPRLFFIQACRSLAPDNTQPNARDEVKLSDLSPKMLVAYSCSPKEAAKRSPKTGSFFIQFLCMNLLCYGHLAPIQTILQVTADFVIQRDRCVREANGTSVAIQRPEFLASDFGAPFRFTSTPVNRDFSFCTEKQRISLQNSVQIWTELSDVIAQRRRLNQH